MKIRVICGQKEVFAKVHAGYATSLFWQAVKDGRIIAIISDVLDGELKEGTKDLVYEFLASLPESQVQRVELTTEAIDLARQYIEAKVIGLANLNDCRHVALATINKADGIVSWNMRDMVKREKRYNKINRKSGYSKIIITTTHRYKDIIYGTQND